MAGLYRGFSGLGGGTGLYVGAAGLYDGAAGFEDGDGTAAPAGDFLLLESGDILLLESGDSFLLETGGGEAPTLSVPIDEASGQFGALLSVNTNNQTGTLYWYISTSATPPSAANLKAGVGATAYGSQAIVALTTQEVDVLSGLASNTGYYAHFIQTSSTPEDSNIVSGDGFTTDAIQTPVIVKTSAAGDPMTFYINDVTAAETIGLYINVQVASNSAFTLPLSGEGAVRDGWRIITSTDFTDENADGQIEMDNISQLNNQPEGTLYVRIRFGVDNGATFLWGNWSNSLNDDIVVLQPSTFDGTAKGPHITRSGGNLIITSDHVQVGAAEMNRIDNSRTGPRYFEMTVGDLPTGSSYAGVGPASFGWTGFNVPGSASNSGAALDSNGTVTNGGSSTTGVTSGWATGNIIMVAFNTTAGKVWFGRNGTWNGDPATGTGGFTPTGMTEWYGCGGMTVKVDDHRSLTFNGGATAFTYSPPSGFTGYDL